MLRPLSPHLQIYKLQLTSALSILHRLSGIVLVKMLVFFVAFLYCLSRGEESYTTFCLFLNHPLIKPLFILGLGCVYYHFFNGIRYIFWSFGYGYDLTDAYKSGWLVVFTAFILTILTSILL